MRSILQDTKLTISSKKKVHIHVSREKKSYNLNEYSYTIESGP